MDIEQRHQVTPLFIVEALTECLNPLKELLSCYSNLEYPILIFQNQKASEDGDLKDLLGNHCKLPIKQISKKTILKPGTVYLNQPQNTFKLWEEGFISVVKAKENDNLLGLFLDSINHKRDIPKVLYLLSEDSVHYFCNLQEHNNSLLTLTVPSLEKLDKEIMEGRPKEHLIKHDVSPTEALRLATEHFGIVQENIMLIEDPQDYREEIFSLIYHHKNHDFSRYKDNTLHRRIERRMKALDMSDLKVFFEFLSQDSREIDVLYKELLIGVTQFFRDKETFDYLQADLIPKLLNQSQDRF
jgi:two-component system CheB/CheR fusion protein